MLRGSIARHQVRQHERPDSGARGHLAYLLGRGVRLQQLVGQRLLAGIPRLGANNVVDPGRVDRLMHQNVRATRQLDQVFADRGIAREHDRACRGVEAIREIGVDQPVRYQDGADLDAFVLPDGERFHRRRGIGVRILDHAGRHRNIVCLEELPDVRHAFAAHAYVEVGRHAGDDGFDQVAGSGGRVLGMDHHVVLHARRERRQHAAPPGAVYLHGGLGAAPRARVVHQEIRQVDDVVGVQVSEEHRLLRAGFDAGAAQLPVCARTQVYDVGPSVHQHGGRNSVGRGIAVPGRSARDAQQHELGRGGRFGRERRRAKAGERERRGCDQCLMCVKHGGPAEVASAPPARPRRRPSHTARARTPPPWCR
ncbi:hypothetical protein FQZ97_654890 [compost metagenome]